MQRDTSKPLWDYTGQFWFESDLGCGARVAFVYRFSSWWAEFERRSLGISYKDCVVVLPSEVKRELQRLSDAGWWSDNPNLAESYKLVCDMSDKEFRQSGIGIETLRWMIAPPKRDA